MVSRKTYANNGFKTRALRRQPCNFAVMHRKRNCWNRHSRQNRSRCIPLKTTKNISRSHFFLRFLLQTGSLGEVHHVAFPRTFRTLGHLVAQLPPRSSPGDPGTTPALHCYKILMDFLTDVLSVLDSANAE